MQDTIYNIQPHTFIHSPYSSGGCSIFLLSLMRDQLTRVDPEVCNPYIIITVMQIILVVNETFPLIQVEAASHR